MQIFFASYMKCVNVKEQKEFEDKNIGAKYFEIK